ncbi:MAG: long-chain fatty acid--CoA ligase, partial [Comamonadaceae bacterium]
MHPKDIAAYPEGVARDIDPGQFRSLRQLFETAFDKHGDAPFSVCMERWMSYRELERLSRAAAGWLQSLGLEPDARIAIMLPNIPQFAVTMAGVLRGGYTCVNVNPLYTARELEHQLNDSGATAIVILENFAHTLEQVIDRTQVQHVLITAMGDELGGLYGSWITTAVRHLAKMVPPYKLPLDACRQGLG